MTRTTKALLLALFYLLVCSAVALGYADTLFPMLTFAATTLAWVFVVRYGFALAVGAHRRRPLPHVRVGRAGCRPDARVLLVLAGRVPGS